MCIYYRSDHLKQHPMNHLKLHKAWVKYGVVGGVVHRQLSVNISQLQQEKLKLRRQIHGMDPGSETDIHAM